MNDVRKSEEPRKNPLRLVLWGVAAIGVLAFLYVIAAATFKPAENGGLIGFRRGALAKLEIPGELKPRDAKRPDIKPEISPPAVIAPDIPLIDAAGRPVKLSDLRGNIVVLNLWATWCAPCKVEMPTLNALSAAYAVQPVKVLAVSVDREKDKPAARAEMSKYDALPLLFDEGYKLAFGLAPPSAGVPTTVIFDKKGLERARITGEADWNSKEARALIEHLLRE